MGNAIDTLPLLKQVERFPHCFGETRRTRSKRLSQFVVCENLTRVGLEISSNFSQEQFAEFGQLRFANTANTPEFGFSARIETSHLAQSYVGENDVGGD